MRPSIRRSRLAGACLVALTGLSPHFAHAAAATQPARSPATLPAPGAAIPANDIRLNFKDVPLDVVLQHLSQVVGFVVVKEAPVDGRVTVMSERPVSPEEAVTILDTVLKSNGFTAIRSGQTLRIVARDKAKKGDIPVHFGSDPAQIASNDQIITQVIPIKNVDAVKLREDLRPLIGTDADVAANGGSNAIVLTDNSSNIKRITEIISLLDKRESGTGSEIRVIQLKNASAGSAAKLIMAIFHPEEPAGRQKGQQPGQQPPQPPPQEKALGNGVDQALHGGKVVAASDDRTNTVVIAGPAETIKIIESMIHDLDANPATVVTIHSYHLKIADAESVARLIMAVFEGEGTNQIRGAGEGPMRAHVSAVPEYRTNTVVVTAPSNVQTVIEGLVKELESNPSGEATYRSFHLKYADATTTADALASILNQNRRRYGPGNMERVNITPDVRTNTVIVTGPTEQLREAERIIHDLDANPTDGTETKFFHLQMADADTVAKMIGNFFNPPDAQRRAQQGQLPLHDLLRHAGVNAQADERSNTVLVTAPTDAMQTIDQLIRQVETQPWVNYDIRSYSLTYADADATAKLISSVFAPDQPTAAGAVPGKPSAVRTKVVAAPDERTNTVVVTAAPESLKVIDALVKLLDSNPGTGEDMKVFPLQYADAAAAATLIQSMFPQPGGTSSGGRSSYASSSTPPPNMPKMPVVIAAADERTNTLVVTAPGDVLKVVETLVKQLDSNPASKQTFFIYRLRNGQSDDMAFVMNQLFENVSAGGANPGLANRSGQRSGAGQQRSSQFASGFGGGRGFGGQTGGGFGANGFGNRRNTSSFAGYSGASSVPGGLSQVASELAGQVVVVSDPDTNSLLVTTASRYELQVRQIIAELDRPVPQVLIKVLLAEVTHDNNADFGTDFSILNTRPNGKGQSFGQTFGMPSQGLVVNFLESNLNATLHALAQQNKLDVLSRPYILASDNQEANVLVGQEVPIVTSNYTTALGQTVSNYQYQDVGIMLDVTPHINPDGLVTLDVSPQISQLTAQTVNVGPGVNVPVIAARTANSRVAIRDGQTIVIGGLMQDQKTLTVNKIPILGDIPLIGYAFSRTIVDKTKTELLIFLTPHVAQQPDLLNPMSNDEMKGTRLTPSAVSPGTFDEHLRGLQRGAAPNLPPASQPTPPALEFRGAQEPTTQPEPETIHLPIH